MIPAEDLIPAITRSYDIGAIVSCEHTRRGYNDTYELSTADVRYIFRVYLTDKYYIGSDADFAFELSLIYHLAQSGIPACAALRRTDGAVMGYVDSETGKRPSALFPYAPGELRRELDCDQSAALGDVVARMHVATDSFVTNLPRYTLGLRYLTEEPMDLMDSLLKKHGHVDVVERYRPKVDELEGIIRRIPTSSPAYGIIHGDLHFGNMHFGGAQGLSIFDFDHCAYGWRAYDLAVCKPGMNDEQWSAFLGAYEAVRPLVDVERTSIAAFVKVRSIWDKGDVLAMCSAWGEEMDGEFAEGIVRMFGRLFPED